MLANIWMLQFNISINVSAESKTALIYCCIVRTMKLNPSSFSLSKCAIKPCRCVKYKAAFLLQCEVDCYMETA